MTKRAIIVLFFALILPVRTLAVEVRAFVDRTQIPVGESISLTVTIGGGQGVVDTSPIRDFKVVSRGSNSSIQIINGKTSQELSYNYTLIPLRNGKLVIPPLPVESGGKRYMTREISVNVSKTPPNPKRSRDVFIEGRVSKTEPYLGEQIIYSFRVYYAVRVNNLQFTPPDFTGFTTEKIEDKHFQTTLNGNHYNITERTIVLIPENTGPRTIEPAMLELDILSQGRSGNTPFDSIFNDPFFGRRNYVHKTFQTDRISVNVKPLPAYQGDVPFSGLVGDFDIRAELEKTDISVGESATLSVAVGGTGNVMDAKEPVIPIPDHFKTYKDAAEEDIHLGQEGYSGTKTFRVALVPLEAGKYDLEPVRIAFFDAPKGQYIIKETAPFHLNVKASENQENLEVYSSPEAPPASLKKKVEFTGRDILSVKEDLDAVSDHSLLPPLRFLLFMIIPVIVFVITSITLTLTKKKNDTKSVMMQRAQAALKKAETASGEAFSTWLYKSLVSAILAQAETNGVSLTYSEAENLLYRSGYPEETARKAAELLEKIELTKYSGVDTDPEYYQNLLTETRLFIRSLSA